MDYCYRVVYIIMYYHILLLWGGVYYHILACTTIRGVSTKQSATAPLLWDAF